MPDFYAHQVFGAKVFSALPEPVRRRLEPERPGWLCGCLLYTSDVYKRQEKTDDCSDETAAGKLSPASRSR